MDNFEKRPLIGITPSYIGGLDRGSIKMSGEYFSAVWAAGGIAVFLQWADPDTPDGRERIKEYACTFDGFLFGGGDDIDPKYYGEEIQSDTVTVTPERDRFELALFKEVYKNTSKPVMGICRGCQLINVAMGGDLYQDILGHRQPTPAKEVFHEVTIPKGCGLYNITRTSDTDFCGRLQTNSTHHQAVRNVAPGLKVAAVAADGTVEAVESVDLSERYITAVQWHPEQLFGKYEAMLAIFKQMIKECKTK